MSTGKAIAPIKVEHGGYEKHDVFGAYGTEGETTEEASSDALSGDNEAPSAYDPENGYYYVCSRKGLDYAYMTSNPPALPVYTEGGHYEGTPFLTAAHIGTQGWLTAYNMKTGQIAWEKEWPHECYSGITTTAGNLLITGDIEGQMLVYNATTGEKLWETPTGTGAVAAAATYLVDAKYDLPEALKWENNSIQNEDRFENEMTKSRILAAMGQTAESQQAKDKALSLGSAQQLYGYGRQLQREGKQQEAFAIFKQAAQKDPNNWLSHAGLARIAVGEGNYPEATKQMQMALAGAPDPAKSGVEGLIKRLQANQDINK